MPSGVMSTRERMLARGLAAGEVVGVGTGVLEAVDWLEGGVDVVGDGRGAGLTPGGGEGNVTRRLSTFPNPNPNFPQLSLVRELALASILKVLTCF